MNKLLSSLLILLLASGFTYAQNKSPKTRTEVITEYDKKTKKDITHKESVIKYNAAGDPVEEWGYDKKGIENKHIKYEYNAAGKKIKEIHLDSKGAVKRIIEITYDANGKKIMELEKTPDGKKVTLKRTFTYEY